MSEMESWSWPPRYDETYRPPEKSRYWFPKRETMAPGDREKAIVARLREVCSYAYQSSNFYQTKWDEAGFHPDQVKSLEAFESKCPVIAKADLRKSQERHPPFGDYLCVPDSKIFHIHGTSGTTGRPTAFGISEDDWKAIANAHARIMWASESARATWSFSPPSSASTWEAGEPWPARSGWAARRSLSAPAHRA